MRSEWAGMQLPEFCGGAEKGKPCGHQQRGERESVPRGV